MVDHHIDHEVHISLVQGIGKRKQVFLSTKVRIELVDVLSPITVESFPVNGSALDVGDDW